MSEHLNDNALTVFMSNLFDAGMERSQVAELGYHFALAQDVQEQQKGAPVTSHMMLHASSRMVEAMTWASVHHKTTVDGPPPDESPYLVRDEG